MLVALLIACAAPSPVVGQTRTEGGTWSLALDTTSYDAGNAEVDLNATDAASGAPAAGLTLYARPDMDDMAHTLDVVDFVETDAGRYTGAFAFDMAGIWTLTGYAADAARTESFTLVVEVLP